MHSVPTVPDLQSVTITSSPGTIVHKGFDVTLNCSVQMNQHVSPFELSLLVMNASLTRPDGAILGLSNPIIVGTNFTYTAQVISFGGNDTGNYTCTAAVRPQPSAIYLTGMGQLESSPLEIIIGK